MKKSKPIGLDFLAADLGFEPRQTESESVVLPLHKSAIYYFYNAYYNKAHMVCQHIFIIFLNDFAALGQK